MRPPPSPSEPLPRGGTDIATAATPPASDNPVIAALDLPEMDQAEELARRLEGEVGAYKIGLELFSAHGPEAVRTVGRFGRVFLDLKLHDIPTTVYRAALQVGRLGISLLTVHASGGPAMVEAAVEGLAEGNRGTGRPDPLVLGVTVLTSMSDDDLTAVAQPKAAEQAPHLARLAVDAGAPGLVCAVRDLAAVRAAVGDEVTLVTPGIRPAGSSLDDHARSATPEEAISGGADLLVVGRPISRAADPVTAARQIVGAVEAARSGGSL